MASIVRLFYSFIDKSSRDATFDLTRVGVCTYVTLPPQSLIRMSKPSDRCSELVNWPPEYLSETLSFPLAFSPPTVQSSRASSPAAVIIVGSQTTTCSIPQGMKNQDHHGLRDYLTIHNQGIQTRDWLHDSVFNFILAIFFVCSH